MCAAPAAGLSSVQAAERLASQGPNELPSARPRRIWQQAWDVIREPMLLLLLAAGAINFLLAEPLDGTLLMLTVLIVIGISLFSERKTEHALAALRDLSAPRALVLRDGQQVRIPGREVVRSDVVYLAEGDRVPVDAVVVEATNLTVDEAMLTGESIPVVKCAVDTATHGAVMGDPGGDATPWVFSGTLVVQGRGVAIAVETGSATQLGRIGTALRAIDPGRTPLQREIDRIVRVVSIAGLAAATVVIVLYGLTRGNWLEGLLAGIATTMSMLPEEFPVVLTVFLALGAWRMSRHAVLARSSPVIETLGSATVVCVDKTGTLTMNSMQVSELIVDGVSWIADDGQVPEDFCALAEFAALASPIDPFDPMDRAVRELGGRIGLQVGNRSSNWRLVREYPVTESRLALVHAWELPDGHSIVVAAKGAPEAIADLCHLSESDRATLHEQVARASAGGQRVIAVARTEPMPAERFAEDPWSGNFRHLGLVCLHDPLRPGVTGAVEQCRLAGVRIVMMTGDYPGTAMAIAREIGLDVEAGYLTGAQVMALTEQERADRIREVSVFARMVPEHKFLLVRALKAAGEVVGMTGDGVNDAPALRAADIGIAMGARGTDVAREAAGLVITDDDFGSIVAGIQQGRGILDKLRKAMAYIVAVHVVIFGMSLIPVLGPSWPLVLLPLQIALLELIIDPACSIVFEAEQPDPAVMDRPPRGLGEPVLDRRVLTICLLQGVGVLLAVLAVYWWALLSGRSDEQVRSVTFGALVVGNLALILVNRSWRLSVWRAFAERRNRALPWILIGGIGLLVMVLTVPVVRDALRLGEVSPVDVLVMLLAGCSGVLWFEGYKWRQRATSSSMRR